jgi:hypothetical protein
VFNLLKYHLKEAGGDNPSGTIMILGTGKTGPAVLSHLEFGMGEVGLKRLTRLSRATSRIKLPSSIVAAGLPRF